MSAAARDEEEDEEELNSFPPMSVGETRDVSSLKDGGVMKTLLSIASSSSKSPTNETSSSSVSSSSSSPRRFRRLHRARVSSASSFSSSSDGRVTTGVGGRARGPSPSTTHACHSIRAARTVLATRRDCTSPSHTPITFTHESHVHAVVCTPARSYPSKFCIHTAHE